MVSEKDTFVLPDHEGVLWRERAVNDEVGDRFGVQEGADVVGLLLRPCEDETDLEIVYEERVIRNVVLEELQHRSELVTGIDDDQRASAALVSDPKSLAIDETSSKERNLIGDRRHEAELMDHDADVFEGDGEHELFLSIEVRQNLLKDVRHTLDL
jgi:hypothetical protein